MSARNHASLCLPLATLVAVACAGNPDRQTLAGLQRVEPDTKEIHVEDGLEQAMQGYRDFLAQAPTSHLTPEAMRRLADLKLEKEFGVLGAAAERPATFEANAARAEAPVPARLDPAADPSESDEVFEARALATPAPDMAFGTADLDLPEADEIEWAGPEEAIVLYDRILAAYPGYAHNDQVLYQKARAYDELGKSDEAIAVIQEMIERYPRSPYLDEVQFRRGEYYFTRRKYYEAELAYAAAVEVGRESAYFELALYKLGWSLYKQEMHEEALHRYIALLDYKVESGYDFDQTEDDGAEQRIADTYRVISLSFSSLGGATAVSDYFASYGRRDYEDRVYQRLGEFYFEKLRYQDAAQAYTAFVDLNPHHRSAPQFGMRIVEIYESGGFPKLVLDSKKAFAERYALDSDYWTHVPVEESPEVVAYLRGNLEDLATHHHAVFQDEKFRDDREVNFAEASRWYRAYLGSFSAETEAPRIHHRLADLLLEHEDFDIAALEYEHTAYDYPAHEKAAEAGYAAIFAHRENEKVAEQVSDEGEAHEVARRAAVASTLRFVEAFPEHEHAAVVLGAAVDDLYAMQDYPAAIERGHQLIEQYPEAEVAVLRAAWAAVAHSHFDTENYAEAETGYTNVLERTAADDPARADVSENLAAAIYKQGEAARAADDQRLAADHFLRIREVAPASSIRPAAEYDAASALVQIEDWSAAARVLEDFREAHPGHELQRDVTKQIASVYRSAGDLVRAGEEYERVAEESESSDERREALLLAGDLFEEARETGRALAVYERYIAAFPTPLGTAAEIRFKIAEVYGDRGERKAQERELREIVALHDPTGSDGDEEVRYFAAKSALLLAARKYDRFAAVELVQPFDKNLAKKKARMDEALAAFEALVDYEVGEATAGATYYIAQVYLDFSRSLLHSERPTDLSNSELSEYELVLEEEAFPFEEQSIEVHEKNLELMTIGVYNEWVEKSLHELAQMMPGRYAKFEHSTGPVDSIDEYAYRVPEVELPATPEPASNDAPAPAADPIESVHYAPSPSDVEAG